MLCLKPHLKLGKRGAAFSVIELMLAISIMGLIMYALFSVFNQTQRALRASETQGGISEKARAIMEIITRELEQVHPAHLQFSYDTHVTNFYSTLDFIPRIQSAGGSSLVKARTNVLDSFFFTRKETNFWNVIGYKINHATNVVGELKRFSWTNNFPYAYPFFTNVSAAFLTTSVTNEVFFHHIADGVIHFRLTPYDINGLPLGYNSTNNQPGVYRIFRSDANGAPLPQMSDVPRWQEANVMLQQSIAGNTNYTTATFTSNAVPAYVELELGMLEQDTLRQYYQMLQDANPNANSFLTEKISKVHLFRQRIPIRTAAQ